MPPVSRVFEGSSVGGRAREGSADSAWAAAAHEVTSQMHALRTSLTSRRANLAIPPHTLVATPESWTERRALIAEELEQTRRVLVSELMEVFHVRRVDAEPEEDDEDDDDDVEDDEGDEEWVIGSGKGVVLPSPEEIDGPFRSRVSLSQVLTDLPLSCTHPVYPSLETQAALLHTSHLLRLLSLYTSHSLPTPLPSPAPPPAPKPTTLSIRPPTIAQTTYHAAHLLASLGIPLAPPPPGELSSSPSPFRPSPPEEDRKQRRNSPSVLRALAGIAEGEWGPPLTLGRGASPEESEGGSGSSSKRRDKSSKDHPEEETKEERRARRRERKERKERKEREAASKKAAASGSGRLDEWEVVDGGVG